MAHEKTNLTDKNVAKLAPSGNVYWDPVLAGFGVRISSANARSWVFRWRDKQDRKQHLHVIGDTAAWPAALARDKAAEWARTVDLGGDPRATNAPRARRDDANLRRSGGALSHDRIADEGAEDTRELQLSS